MTRKPTNIQASIADRLRNIAIAARADLQLILRRYAIERLLYRLSVSPFRDRFVLKGAMLYTAWVPDPFRTTQDLDLLGFGDPGAPSVTAAFRAISQQSVPDDGLTFDPASIATATIRGRQEYGGMRVKMTASLGKIRVPVQIDIGYGDAVTPAPVELEFPVLLDTPAPRLRAYPKETVVAEKLQAMVALGQVNSRMKDYYDIAVLARLFEFDGSSLSAAFRATFDRRQTPIPVDVPIGLSEQFIVDPRKIALWSAFTRREALLHDVGDLGSVVGAVRGFVLPPLASAAKSRSFSRSWKSGGPWRVQRKRAGSG
jgi:predicted nucleotidyltransferase component of viral defense system